MKKRNPLLLGIRDRLLKKNKNYLAIFVGPTGSSKSLSAITLALGIDPTFTADNIVFSAREFMQLLNSGKLKKGSVVIWDEAGVGISRRNWYEMSNKLINYVLQTFRTKNIAVLFTTPALCYIDTNTVKLFQALVEMLYINTAKQQAVSKYFNVVYKNRGDKTLFVYPKRRNKEGRIVTKKRLGFARPPLAIERAYDIKRDAFTSGLNKEVEKAMVKVELKEAQEPKETAPEILKIVLEDPTVYLNKVGKISLEFLMAQHNVGRGIAGKVKAMADRQI